MRRLMLVLLVVLMLAVPVVSVSAQTENQGLWNLTQTFTVNDLGFVFLYPEKWVHDVSNGIVLAENGDDIAAEVDEDETTQPKGLTVRLGAYTFDQVGLTPEATLDEAVAFVVEATGLQVEEQFDLPVMTRRTVNLFGTAPSGRHVLATLWIQDGSLIIWQLNTPNAETTVEYAFSWGQLLGSAAPINEIELTAKPVTTNYGGVSLLHPADWPVLTEEAPWQITDTNGGTGYSLFLVRGPMSDFITTANPTLEDVLDAAMPILQLDPANSIYGEHLLFQDPATQEYLPAISVHGATTAGIWIKAVVTTLPNGEIFIIVHGAPDEASMQAFVPTWIAVLSSLTPTAETAGS